MSSFVTIKKPYKLITQKLRNDSSNVHSLRLRDDEVKLIEYACNKLDTKFSTFIKYCAVEVAKEIKREDDGI